MVVSIILVVKLTFDYASSVMGFTGIIPQIYSCVFTHYRFVTCVVMNSSKVPVVHRN